MCNSFTSCLIRLSRWQKSVYHQSFPPLAIYPKTESSSTGILASFYVVDREKSVSIRLSKDLPLCKSSYRPSHKYCRKCMCVTFTLLAVVFSRRKGSSVLGEKSTKYKADVPEADQCCSVLQPKTNFMDGKVRVRESWVAWKSVNIWQMLASVYCLRTFF